MFLFIIAAAVPCTRGKAAITLREFYNIEGTRLFDLTNHLRFPGRFDRLSWLGSFETPENARDNYGVQIQGFLSPPLTGDYLFYLSSDDQGALFLSADESAENKRLIALEPEWNAARNWVGTERRPNRENISLPIRLEAGRKYFIEALMKEGAGGDNLGVAWRKPGDPEPRNGDAPISGAYLSPMPFPVAANNPPAPPARVEIEMQLSARLLWSASVSPGVMGYVVSRSSDGSNWENIAFVEKTTFADTGVGAGHAYQYRVAAVNLSYETGPPSPATEPAFMTMLVRQIEDYNYESGKFPGFFRSPYAVEASSPSDLDPKNDFYYKFYDYWVPPNPYRPDAMVVVDDDPAPDVSRWIIGWTSPGDWWRYTFEVPEAGWVKLALRAATPGVSTINVFWDEELVTTINCNTGDWGRYDDFEANESFYSAAGRHTLRLQIADSATNLDLIGVAFGAAPPARRILFQDNFEGYSGTEALRLRGGWSIINGSGVPSVAWRIQHSGAEPRPGFFAGMNDNYIISNSGESQRARVDEALVSPMIDCRGFSQVRLLFANNIAFNGSNDSPQNCDIDVNVYDEVSNQWSSQWTTAVHWERNDGNVTARELISLASWADGKRIRLRWRFHDARWDHWWALDSVQITGEGAAPLSAPAITSFVINDGAAVAADRVVQIRTMTTGNPSFMMLSERADFVGSQWQPYTQEVRFSLSPNLGAKTIYLKLKNEAGASAPGSGNVTLSSSGPSFTVKRALRPPVTFPEEQVEVEIEVGYSGGVIVTNLELEETLPVGWIFDSVVRGPAPAAAPSRNQTGSLLFRWDSAPQWPFLLVYRIRFAGEEFMGGTVKGEARLRSMEGAVSVAIGGDNSLREARSDTMFHRLLYHGTVLSSEEWDWIADAGFTLVHSYGGSPEFLRQMMDEAHKRGLKMIAGSWQGQQVPWMRLALNTGAAGAPVTLRFDVRHHYSDPNPSLVFFATPGHPLHLLQVSLENPNRNTLGKLATYVNSLGYGLSAQVESGKEAMSSQFLATSQYGDLAGGQVTVYGSELPNSYRQYIQGVKDHPALFCFVSFDDGDLLYFSPNFQRYVTEQIRQWAPGVPVYYTPWQVQPANFAHDHKQDHRSADGVINYIYPGVLPDHVDVIRTQLQDRWSFHARAGFKPWMLLGKAMSFSGALGVPPKGSLIEQWEAAKRSGVPLTGFGFYAFQHDGGTFAISGIRSLQEECREVNRRIAEEYFDVRIVQDGKRIQATGGDVKFQAAVYGGKPPFVLQWDFGDGEMGWGENISHRYTRAGMYQVKVTCLDSRGRMATKETRVYLTGGLSPGIREDFNDGVADNFVVRGGSWAVESGRYTQTGALGEPAWSSISTLVATRYSVDADVTFTAPGGEAWIIWSGAARNADSRLTWRVPDEPDFTLKGTSLLELQTDTGIAKAYIAFDRSRTYHITADVFEDVVAVSVDGTLILEQAIGTRAGDGVVGFGAKNTRAAFDNLSVAALPGMQATVSLTGPEPTAAPYAVNFSAAVTGGTEPFTFAWDFGDGSTSTLRAPQHVYASMGAWKVSLRVTDANGQSASSLRTVMTGARIYFREAEDYDWTDGAPPGYPVEAGFGVKYGAGQKGRRGVDFYQLHTDEGDLRTWRDSGNISLETGQSDTGINLRGAGATDWWNYTFQFPTPGVARIRAFWAAAGPASGRCRVFWKGQSVGDLVIPGNGAQNYTVVETPPFAVDSTPGQLQFRPLDWGLNFARFEVVYVPAADSDADGVADILDLDSDNDGFMDADELTNGQSNSRDAGSRPKDQDGDFVSDSNDPDDDSDGVPDGLDAHPLIANRPPMLVDIEDQTIRASEPVTVRMEVVDIDLPPQKLTFSLVGTAPDGASISSTGVFAWTPQPNHALQSFNVNVAVTDSGLPPLTTTKSFRIHVTQPRSEGFDSVTITTTNGPVTLLVPRKHYEFTSLNRTLYLATNGNDENPGTIDRPWKTFASALPKLQPGDVLYVREGEYAEPFEARLRGSRERPIVISVYPGERVRIVQPEGWQDIRNQDAATIQLRDCAFLWLHGFEVYGGFRPGKTPPSGYGRACILNRGEIGVRILNNQCRWGIEHGIMSGGNGGELIEGNVIWECSAPWSGSGIQMDSANSNPAIVRGNAIVNSGVGLGINWRLNGVVHVYNNVVSGVSTIGQFVRRGTHSVIAHNVYAGNGAAGLSIEGDSSTNVFLNNIYSDSNPRHLLRSDYFGQFDGAVLGNVLDYSLFDPRSEFASPLEWFTPWIGTNLVHADPLFIDPTRYDFRLAANSPARNAAGPVKLLGTLPYPHIGLFPATYYWQPDLIPVPDLEANEFEELRYQLQLAVTNTAVTKLRFELGEGTPEGAYLNPATGLFIWTPSEFQGPGSYIVTVHAMADDSPLVTSTASFRVNVREVNAAPMIGALKDQAVTEGTLLDLDVGKGVRTFGLSDSGAPNVSSSAGLLRDRFNGIPGTSLADLTNSTKFPALPERTELVTTGFEMPRDEGDNYGQRLRGFVVPSQTGNYTFWIASDDASILYLSSDESPLNMRPVARVNGWTNSREWTKEPGQKSSPVHLEAGRRYYIEALMKDGTGGDNLAVRWQLPTGAFETPIPSSRLLAWEPNPVITSKLVSAGPPGLQREVFVIYQPGGDLTTLTNSNGFPDSPAVSGVLRHFFEAPVIVPPFTGIQQFGQRVRGRLIAPQTGAYKFWLAAGGDSTLYLSSDESQQNARLIARVVSGTDRRQWTKDPAQESAVFQLEQGKAYYVEAMTIADVGKDHLSVRWLLPDGTIEAPIAGTRLVLERQSLFAYDPDEPKTQLTYSLGSDAPAGMAIHSTTGRLTWTPTEAQGPGTRAISIHVTDQGTPSLGAATTFNISVQESNSPPILAPIANQAGVEGTPFSIKVGAADPDFPANALAYTLTSAPPGMSIEPGTGQISWVPDETTGGSSFSVSVQVTDNGVPSLSHSQAFVLTVSEVNAAPVLAGIADQQVDEGKVLLLNTAASDSDRPTQSLRFSLEPGAPAGVSIQPETGVLTWNPTEEQGPGTYTLAVRVEDNGSPPLKDTKTFSVTVNEVNTPPIFAAIGNLFATKAKLFTVTASSTDADIPRNRLTYSLGLGAPGGMSIVPETGVITWTPAEQQALGSFPVRVLVTDDGAPSLSHTLEFTVTVSELNNPPKLEAIADQAVDEGKTLALTISAIDPDAPAQALQFSLEPGAPVGASLHADSGRFTWTPTEEQGPGAYTLTVKVQDTGVPPFSDTKLFNVTVNEVNTAPVLGAISNISIKEGESAGLTITATDTDRPAQKLTFSLGAGAPAGTALDPAAGILSWTPSGPAPSTNVITVTVTDDGTPAMSDTKSFSIIVQTGRPAGLIEGTLLWEAWFNINGNSVSSLTSHARFSRPPSETRTINAFDSRRVRLDDSRENYGARISGFFIPPATGNYRFFVRSDDASQLFLSVDERPENKRLIAQQPNCCNVFSISGSLASSAIRLVAGQYYYIEGLFKEGVGEDYMQVAVRIPGENLSSVTGLQPIPGRYLAHVPQAPIEITRQPESRSAAPGATVKFVVEAISAAPLNYQWRFNGVEISGAVTSELVLENVQPARAGNYDVVVRNASRSVTSSIAVLTVAPGPVPDPIPPSLTVERMPTGIKLVFTGMLQVSESVQGPYRDLAGATSPVEIPFSVEARFYRTRFLEN